MPAMPKQEPRDWERECRDAEEDRWRDRYRIDWMTLGTGPNAAYLASHGCAEITGCDLVKLAQYAYANSEQMGSRQNYVIPQDAELPIGIAVAFVALCAASPSLALDMEWVQTKTIRLVVLRASDDRERLFLPAHWPAHTDAQQAELIAFAQRTTRTMAKVAQRAAAA